MLKQLQERDPIILHKISAVVGVALGALLGAFIANQADKVNELSKEINHEPGEKDNSELH